MSYYDSRQPARNAHENPLLGFWWELKAPLADLSLHDDEYIATWLRDLFRLHVGQVHGQAELAFQVYEEGEYFFAFLIIGDHFSLLKYRRPVQLPTTAVAGSIRQAHHSFDVAAEDFSDVLPDCLYYNRPVFTGRTADQIESFSPYFLQALADCMQSQNVFPALPPFSMFAPPRGNAHMPTAADKVLCFNH